jgi:hypothetical protein
MFKNLTINKRILYFLLACIPIRLLFVIILKKIDNKYLPIFAIPLLLMSLGFLYLYFGNFRLTAPEAGGVTWWKDLRLIHGLLYLTAAIYAFQRKDTTWIPLLMDVILGITVFLFHHKFLQC